MKDSKLTEEDWADWIAEVIQFLDHWQEDRSAGMLTDPPFEPTPRAVFPPISIYSRHVIAQF